MLTWAGLSGKKGEFVKVRFNLLLSFFTWLILLWFIPSDHHEPGFLRIGITAHNGHFLVHGFVRLSHQLGVAEKPEFQFRRSEKTQLQLSIRAEMDPRGFSRTNRNFLAGDFMILLPAKNM